MVEFRYAVAMNFTKLLLVAALSLPFTSFSQTAPEVAPGLTIPSGSRPWALDVYQDKKQLVPIHPSAVQMNSHKKSNIAGGLVAGPFFKAKFTTELEGAASRVAIHTTTPVFYVYMSDNPDEAGTSMIAGWAIVHVAVDTDRRLLSTVKFTQFTGNAKRNASQVEATLEKQKDGWLRIAPAEPLAPGEYALMPVMKQANAFSTMVFDFHVDPAAPNDSDAIQQSKN